MGSDYPSDDVTYSPSISMELDLHGRRFNVSAIGPEFITIRTGEAAAAGQGIVTMWVDGKSTVYQVELPEGIDPAKQRHACRPTDATADVEPPIHLRRALPAGVQ
jgi:hypothetical protein